MARPLAPQPVLPNAQPITPVATPHLQPVRNNYHLKSTRSRRGTINAACHECRLKKLKCDGGRPRCRRCTDRGIDTCEYTVNPGETRFTALKRKNALLLSDTDRMRSFIEALRSASPSQTRNLLDNLRTSESTPLPRTLASQPPLAHRNSDSSSSSVPSHAGTDPQLTQGSANFPVSTLDFADYSSSHHSSTSPEQDICLTQPSFPPFANFEVQLPDETTLRECINTFYFGSGKLFHVFSREHMDSQFQILCGQGDEQSRRVAACELCAVAAIGSQYARDLIPSSTEQAMYGVAKHFLEDVIAVDRLRASKVCAMLTMFNVMHKEKVALMFADTGITLLQRVQSLIPNARLNDDEKARWMAARKTWRTLVFLESWLSSTLGYVSELPLVSAAMDTTKFEIEGEVDLEDKVVTEMIKIAVIKFNMLRLSLSFKRFSALTVETISKELREWYQNLPKEMQFSEPDHSAKTPEELRTTIYYVNLLYFGAHIMLLRRVLHSMTGQENPINGADLAIDELVDQANHAARKSAELFATFNAETGISRRCWVCIFQAYSSCVLLLHESAQGLLHGTRRPDDELNLAAICLDFLRYCQPADVAARQFVQTLAPLYDRLRAATISQSTTSRADVEIAAAALRDLIIKPLKTRKQESSRHQEQWTQQHFDEPRISGVDELLNENIAEIPPSFKGGDWQNVDGITNDGSLNNLIDANFYGHFVPGFESYTWNGNSQL